MLDDAPLAEIEKYIDWTFFFTAWELKGRFPALLDHPTQGPAARDLYENGRALLRKLVDGRELRARGVYGFWPANADGDDIVLFSDSSRKQEVARFPMLRQQRTTPTPSRVCVSPTTSRRSRAAPPTAWARSRSPRASAPTRSRERFEAELDDYHAIIAKSLADRLAEAFAEWLHAQRAPRVGLRPRRALLERGADRREVPRHPARASATRPAPTTATRRRSFELLGAREVGMELTRELRDDAAASVSGLYLAHPRARYFGVGKIGRDQVADYAARKRVDVAQIERWLAPNLGYE